MRYLQLETAVITLIIVGVVAGCATENRSTVPNSVNQTNAIAMHTRRAINKTFNETTTNGPIFTDNTTASNREQVQTWFLNDLKIASNVHFPITAHTYFLNLNYPYVYSSKWLKAPKRNLSNHLWLGSYTGTKKEPGYTFYSSALNMKKLYDKVVNHSRQWLGAVSPIYVLESHSDIQGHFVSKDNGGLLVPAAEIALGNGWALAFARNQVIVQSNHAAVYQYTVISAPGITLSKS